MLNKKLNHSDMVRYVVNHTSKTPPLLEMISDLPYVPRYYQTNAVSIANDYLSVGFRRLLIVSPTGSGKTLISLMLSLSKDILKTLNIDTNRKIRILFIAGQNEFLDQAIALFSPYKEQIEFITQSAFSKIPDDVIDKGWDITFIDEAHHEAMYSIQKLLDSIKDVPVFGLTATPDRGDGKLLKFERLIQTLTKDVAIREKVISTPRINTIIEVEGANKLELAKDIVNLYYKDMGQTFFYFRTQKECRDFHHYCLEKGIKSLCLEQKDKFDPVKEKFENKEIQFLINCQRLGEGIDVKGCTDVFLARHFSTRGEKEQFIGRSVRKDSSCQVWEFASPFKNNVLAKDLFPVVLFHRIIYYQYGKWNEDFIEVNDDSIYDKRILND